MKHLSVPPREPKTKKHTKKKRAKRVKKMYRWKTPVKYSYYLSGFGKAMTMVNLSGFG